MPMVTIIAEFANSIFVKNVIKFKRSQIKEKMNNQFMVIFRTLEKSVKESILAVTRLKLS